MSTLIFYVAANSVLAARAWASKTNTLLSGEDEAKIQAEIDRVMKEQTEEAKAPHGVKALSSKIRPFRAGQFVMVTCAVRDRRLTA